VYPELLEHLISVSASVIYESVQAGYQVGLLSNGCLAHADRPLKILPSRSPKQLGYLLGALAGITPMVMVPFDSFLVHEMPSLPYGASLLVVSAVTTPGLLRTLQRIKQHNRKITLLSLAEEAPEYIPGISVLHSPFKEQKPNEKEIGFSTNA
jgi:hypothetical protein